MQYNTMQYNTMQYNKSLLSLSKKLFTVGKTIYKLIFTLDFMRIHAYWHWNNYNNNSTVLEHEVRKIIAA